MDIFEKRPDQMHDKISLVQYIDDVTDHCRGDFDLSHYKPR
jgi:hypothetical protein